MQDIRLVMIGLGNLGWRFCGIISDKKTTLEEDYGLRLHLVGAADSHGAAYNPEGLDLDRVVAIKTASDTIANYTHYGRWGWGAVDLVEQIEADVLLEASPVNLEQNAEPGLTCIRTAMAKGMHVVTPNKGPLVVAFDELHALAAAHHVKFRYDGTVAGGLPAINVGVRDLRGAKVISIQAVPNMVTGYMMDLIADGLPFDDASRLAKEAGVLEGDGAWDIDGWDAAAKLTILTNAVMGLPARIQDVARMGIRDMSSKTLIEARESGFLYRLLVRTDRLPDGSFVMSAKPTPLPVTHPLGRLGRKQMGVVYETDIYGTISLIINEEIPIPSAATMLRDILDIYTC